MPDILPPQLVGAQQRPLYVKVRTALTVISSLWLIAAITGLGFFSGGTTSLALSLVLLYGTGMALIVVIAAIYRVVKNSAIKRTETAPEDAAAGAFVDTARMASVELRAALRPPAATGKPQFAPVESAAPVFEAHQGSAQQASATQVSSAKSAAKPAANKAAADKPAANKAAADKNAPNKPAPNKAAAKNTTGQNTAAAKTTASKPTAGKTATAGKTVSKPAAGTKTGSKKPQSTTPLAAASPAKKGRPANSNGSKQPAKRTGSSGNRTPSKKQSGVTEGPSTPGPGASAQACTTSARPALVLASSSASPQMPRVQYVPDSRQRAS